MGGALFSLMPRLSPGWVVPIARSSGRGESERTERWQKNRGRLRPMGEQIDLTFNIPF